MEINVTQENLSRALAAISRVANSKAGLPILGNILFRTEGSRLLVAATNLEIAATYYVGAKVTKQGDITLPARLISDLVSSLPKDVITISCKGLVATIKSGKFSSIMTGVETSEFPELPSIDESEAVSYNIAIDEFKQAVGQVIIATSSDTARPVLTGVYWHSIDGKLYLTGTDGYRLAERRLVDTKSEIDAVIPTTTLQEVLRVITDSTEQIDILFDDSQVRFRVGEAEITSRLIEGKYPPYRQLIPEKSDIVIQVRADNLSQIVKVAGLFARQSGGGVTVTANAEENQIQVHSIASDAGENTSVADAKVTGSGDITLNSRYITDALNSLDGDVIEFRFGGKLLPCVLSVVSKDPNYIHIIMPLKS